MVMRTILWLVAFSGGGPEDGAMALSYVLDPPLTDELREQLVELWVSVVNAGGAVGFVPPVTTEDVLPTAQKEFAGAVAGRDVPLVGFEGRRPVCLLFISDNGHRLKAHWRILRRVMVAPGAQGRGYGAELMREAAEVGRELGLTGLEVTVRAGMGTEDFYAKLGYTEVGRLPGVIRVSPGDDRDEIIMWKSLD
jgi:GNAT superfamily N-acetyltransferase